jgi:hypothetical protein
VTGYANRVIKIDFPELSEDPENDRIFVIIRNPRLMPAKEITSVSDTPGAYDDKGKILDRALAEQATDKLIAKLVIAHRVYDASYQGAYDALTGEPLDSGEQPLLPPAPWGPETAAKLPAVIRLRIAEEFAQAQNPPQGSGAPIQKTSSGSPSPSTTEPGAGEPSQPS